MNKNLANLIRPNNLRGFICDNNLKIIFENIIKNNDLRSFIFYGPPGVGKTTISYILANSLNVSYTYFNAAIDKKDDLIHKLKLNKILIIDEIHRLNKDKQDILLPYLENDLITVYATTTENPYFKINPALRSRSSIIELKKPTKEQLIKYLENINNSKFNLNLDKKIYEYLALQSGLDFRVAINNLDLVNKLSKNKNLEIKDIQNIIPSIQFSSDKNGDNHYDYLSAFHKSLRGSDADAALYYGFLDTLREVELSAQRRKIIEMQCAAAAAIARQYEIGLKELFASKVAQLDKESNALFTLLERDDVSADELCEGMNKFADLLGKKISINSMTELDSVMLSKNVLII